MKLVPVLVAASLLSPVAALDAQERRDGVVFAQKKDAKLDAIKAELRKKEEPPAKKRMWVDFAAVDAPKSVSEFTKV